MLNHHSRLCRAVLAPLVALATVFLSFGIAKAQDAPATAPTPSAEATVEETPAPSTPEGYEVAFLINCQESPERVFALVKKQVRSIIESLRQQAGDKPVRVGFVRYPMLSAAQCQVIDLSGDPGSIETTLRDMAFVTDCANNAVLTGLYIRSAVDRMRWSKNPRVERRIYVVDYTGLGDGAPLRTEGTRVELLDQVPVPGVPNFRVAARYAVSRGFTVSVVYCILPGMEKHLRELHLSNRAWLASGKRYDLYATRAASKADIPQGIGPMFGEHYYWARINWEELAYLGRGEFYTLNYTGEARRMSPEQVRYRAEVTMPREVLATEIDEWHYYLDLLLRLRNSNR